MSTPITATINHPAGRVVFLRAPSKRLTEEQIAIALSGLDDASPVWLAVNQLLDEELAAAVLDSSSPTLDSSKGTYSGGKTAALAELKERLIRYRTAPVKAAPARGGKK